MKTFLKENWFKLVVVLIVILIGASLFYWFQFRPSKIRANCIKVKESCVIKGYINPYNPPVCTEQTKETQYKDCLRESGLEK